MPVSKDCFLTRDSLDSEMRSRDRIEGELDRLRIRERLEATLAGLGELEYLKQRHELLVRTVLSHGGNAYLVGEENIPRMLEENYPNPQEKALEENILLLRKQLNRLRRRDAGLINQLQELDRQISDLRLDCEKPFHDHLETDSRPSSGFYELSDGASGSLSNSSNSVFSECLSSCRSSTCFCSPLDASLSVTDGCPKSSGQMLGILLNLKTVFLLFPLDLEWRCLPEETKTIKTMEDNLAGWIDCVEGQCEDQNSATVRRSLSAPYSASLDGVSDIQTKYQCDLISRNGNDVYRYPSPLHAVAVQSPVFQSLVGHFREEGFKANDSSSDFAKPEQAMVSQSPSCPVPYLQTVGESQGKSSDLKNPRQACLHSKGANNSISAVPPMKQWPHVEANVEQLENDKAHIPCAYQQHNEQYMTNNNELHHNSLSKKRVFAANKGLPLSTVAIDIQKVVSPHSVSSPIDNVYQYAAVSEENKVPQPVKTVPPRKGLKPRPAVSSYLEDRPPLELRSEGSSSQSLDEGGQMVNAQYIPAQKQTVKLRKGGKNVKVVKVRSATLKPRMHTEFIPEICLEKPRMVAKKCHFPEEVSNPHKTVKKGSSKAKKGSSFQPEGSLSTRQASSTSRPTARHHGHGRETVVAKPKYKRSDYRRCKTIAEVPYDEVLRRARRRQKKEILGQVSAVYLRPNAQYSSPYAYIGSDSEYSAECASLFHSTVLDTSEDEKSNYTTNCFGDSESSLSEVDFAGESTTSSDTDESGGLAWPQFGNPAAPVGPSEMTSAQAKAFVKIKASHNLKKKILRFRTGSLKLMTTV
ncbi:DACT1 protein, partial [Polyodon spathula]|nr:DACT1 protein [Polyodon spathula]